MLMSPTGMAESISDSHIQSVPISDAAGLGHSSNLLSNDGANKNQLVLADCLSSAFPSIDFQNMNMTLDSLLPYMTGQGNNSSTFTSEHNSNGASSGHRLIFESLKADSLNGSQTSAYAAVYNNGNGGCSASDYSMQYASIGNHYSNSSCFTSALGGSKSQGASDFESLQQKISQKKQTLDILQGVIPDPLSSQEKKYMTMTERIQVPSSDHVAEIVGKNGQRIKQLREQLKVWVKTPSRDEPPVFEVTGLPEKLAEAKRIILQMSEHFTKVQQERLHRSEPNRTEDRLYVEQDKVGLIVGASGQTIRWVQQLSDTHIATPRKQESIPGLPPPQTFFTICGTPDKVKFAKQLICEYVTLRCQGLWLDPDLEPSAEASRLVRDFHQRRQVEDSQRRTTAPSSGGSSRSQSATMSGSGRALVGDAGISSSSSSGGSYLESAGMKQLITDMGELWGNTCGSSDGSSGPQSPRRVAYQQPMWGSLGLGLTVADRRFSADGAGHAQDASTDSAMRKSRSDDQVSPQVSAFKTGAGWM